MSESKELEGIDFWEPDRYLVLKKNKAYDTIKQVMDHYNLSVEVKNKNIDKKITTDPVSQIIFILRKANQIHDETKLQIGQRIIIPEKVYSMG